jgi:hypothetical protein
VASLLALAACGGGGAPPGPASALEYVDPPGAGWRLVRDPSSTPQRLVLALVGPAGLPSRGAGFNLRAAAGVRFGSFASSGVPVEDAGVYELLNQDGTGDPLEPVLLAAGVKPGNLLTAGIFQKDRRRSAKDSGAPLARIALELDPAAPPRQGAALALTVTKARYSPEDIGAFSPSPTLEMVAKGRALDFDLAVGTLRAR